MGTKDILGCNLGGRGRKGRGEPSKEREEERKNSLEIGEGERVLRKGVISGGKS